MNWNGVIEHNRDALIRIVAALFAMLGIAENAAPERISRALNSAILRILRPAEAAVRRLIVAAARGMALKPHKPRAKPAGKIERTGKGGTRRPPFRLEDSRPPMLPPVKRGKYAKRSPRVIDLWAAERPDVTGRTITEIFAKHHARYLASRPAPEPKPPPIKDGKVDSTRLLRRLQAIKDALEDLPRQAKRLLQWRARREKIAEKRLIYTNPLRYGAPPYVHEKPKHEVEEVLEDCHWLAWEAANEPRPIDSS
ncbi:MAG: hypothetical protein HC855_10910 [Rhizobiales bacterium]|nr:hypothetical protein [Hyphomicrobiales bacterium]